MSFLEDRCGLLLMVKLEDSLSIEVLSKIANAMGYRIDIVELLKKHHEEDNVKCCVDYHCNEWVFLICHEQCM